MRAAAIVKLDLLNAPPSLSLSYHVSIEFNLNVLVAIELNFVSINFLWRVHLSDATVALCVCVSGVYECLLCVSVCNVCVLFGQQMQ